MGLRPTYEDENISVSNLSPRTHHSFLFVIPSAAEGPAVRPSPSRKHRVAALRLLRLSPMSPPFSSPFSTERSRAICGAPFGDLEYQGLKGPTGVGILALTKLSEGRSA
jgi:hypothetical protein